MSTSSFWKWLAIVLFVILIVLVIGLLLGWFCRKQPPGSEEPTARRIEANLHGVQITGGGSRRFQLYSWYRDQHDSIMSGYFEPAGWKFEPGADGAGGTVDRGFVEVSTFPTGGPKSASVQAFSQLEAVQADNIPLI